MQCLSPCTKFIFNVFMLLDICKVPLSLFNLSLGKTLTVLWKNNVKVQILIQCIQCSFYNGNNIKLMTPCLAGRIVYFSTFMSYICRKNIFNKNKTNTAFYRGELNKTLTNKRYLINANQSKNDRHIIKRMNFLSLDLIHRLNYETIQHFEQHSI
jgi:hypothetical protein